MVQTTNWSEFVSCNKSLLIAPAGHGKTTAIADCILSCPQDSCHLVLTHTHAGIASLRTKFKEKGIASNQYQLETISGFAQRIVNSFIGKELLSHEVTKEYFDVIIAKCDSLLKTPLLKVIMTNSYQGAFIDEYQDCTFEQHQLIMKLGEYLPLHILGDSLQAIFTFHGSRLVNFDTDLNDFRVFSYLEYPWRWHKSAPELGNFIFSLRKSLEEGIEINFISRPESHFYVEKFNVDDNLQSLDRSSLRNIINKYDSDSLLIILPEYKTDKGMKGDVDDRIMLAKQFDYQQRFQILDAIDATKHYSTAKKIDKYIFDILNNRRFNQLKHLENSLEAFFAKRYIQPWIKDGAFVKKQKDKKVLSEQLQQLYYDFLLQPSVLKYISIIKFIIDNEGKAKNPTLYMEIMRAAEIAIEEAVALEDGVKRLKEKERHYGRHIRGRCIGSTLLTKGLEFDTVIVYGAHHFVDKNNFYVAISRACRRLVLVTNYNSIQF